MRILAIETSCDETGIAILEGSGAVTSPDFTVLANVVSSQIDIHKQWGGVVPNLAKREHQKNLPFVLLEALGKSGSQIKHSGELMTSDHQLEEILDREPTLRESFKQHIAKLPIPDIDAIAVTQGPGLEPALWVGVNFARALSYWWQKPLIGINHMEGHIYSVLLNRESTDHRETNLKHGIQYPALALLVSGGHTELVLIKEPLTYEVIGQTLDDASGEAFDKVARILGLPYPGGPQISKIATQGNPAAIAFPRPMLHPKDENFSFSGLKTAVLYKVRELEKEGPLSAQVKADVAASFEESVVDVLVAKTLRAIENHGVRTFILGGGVAANKKLRARLSEELSAKFPTVASYLPEIALTGDNAVMIAAAAYLHIANNQNLLQETLESWKTVRPQANMKL